MQVCLKSTDAQKFLLDSRKCLLEVPRNVERIVKAPKKSQQKVRRKRSQQKEKGQQREGRQEELSRKEECRQRRTLNCGKLQRKKHVRKRNCANIARVRCSGRLDITKVTEEDMSVKSQRTTVCHDGASKSGGHLLERSPVDA